MGNQNYTTSWVDANVSTYFETFEILELPSEKRVKALKFLAAQKKPAQWMGTKAQWIDFQNMQFNSKPNKEEMKSLETSLNFFPFDSLHAALLKVTAQTSKAMPIYTT